MKAEGSAQRFMVKALLGVAAVGLACVAALATSFAVANPIADSCGVTSEHELAKAFGRTAAHEHASVLREPENSAGVLRLRCLVLAFDGPKRPGPRGERIELAAGEASKLRMETWVADEGAAAAIWRANFAAKIQALTSRARSEFIGDPPSGGLSLGGRVVALPRLGTEHVLGFLATSGGLVKLRAFWWSASAASIVSMSAVEAKGSQLVGSIKQVAAEVVPAIH